MAIRSFNYLFFFSGVGGWTIFVADLCSQNIKKKPCLFWHGENFGTRKRTTKEKRIIDFGNKNKKTKNENGMGWKRTNSVVGYKQTKKKK